MLDFSNPQIWWYLTRASAMVGWVLLTMTVVWGILLKTRILRGADNPEWLKITHRYISGLAIVMVIIHIVTLLLDDYIQFGLADVLIPFATSFEPLGVALGIFSLYFLIAIQVTALAARWLPEGLWKGIHFFSYATVALVALHSGMVGTDVGTPWYTATSLILITTVTLAALIRIIIAGRSKPPARLGSPPGTEPPAPVASPRQKHPQFLARVVDRNDHGPDIAEFVLTPVDPATELEWDAGSHITVHLPDGRERQYSLSGDPAEQDSLVLGVLDTHGEGGASTWIHENLRVGDTIMFELPKNHFPLKPAPRYQFVASGIGITPLRAMMASVPASREWSLLYIGSSADRMLFGDELLELYGDKVTLWDTSERGRRPPLADLLDSQADVYACGSESVIATIEQNVAPRRLHIERFSPKKRGSTSTLDTVTLTATRSGITTTVGPEESFVDALERSGVPVLTSCKRGVCGSCEVSVLEGTPEHLDSVMSDADKDELGVMYPCVSRSRTPALALDI
jgi:ferredoxin-NADP reductase